MYGNYTPNLYGSLYGQNMHQEIVHVNGENGARAYQLAPNSNILLLDDTAPLVWLCQTDGAGYKTVTPYSITPYTPKVADVSSLEEKVAKLQEKIESLEGELHGKSNTTNAESTNE